MAVAFLALLIALGGTAYAAFGPFKGDKIIKKRTLSANRLVDHTLTGRQVNLTKLGKVPSAANADNAALANNANLLGGQAAGTFFPSSRVVSSDLVKLSGTTTGNTVTVLTSGPFTVTFTCTDNGAGSFTGVLAGSSSEADSVLNQTVVATAGTPQTIDTRGPVTTPEINEDEGVSFQAPSGAHLNLNVPTGLNSLGANCWYYAQGIR